MSPGDVYLLDNVLKVRIVRLLDDARAIVAVGSDTTIVDVANLTVVE